MAPLLAMEVVLCVSCGGSIARSSPDAVAPDSAALPDVPSAGLDAGAIRETNAPPGTPGDETASQTDATTTDDDATMMGTGAPMSGDDAARGDAPAAVDATAHCECQILDTCCAQARPPDSRAACLAEVSAADEAACRSAILRGGYDCLALGLVPRCSAADDALCPSVTLPCSRCLTAIKNCGDVIQCAQDSTCKATLDAVFACDEQGRPFQECFNIFESTQANGSVPGDLVLRGAMCVETCRGDP